ncbi:MAG TPA: phosphate regulon sensor histidine kinase PhoR [Acidiferrobacterales bacterium]|nr:phosphate regulon sensor histidine kinase PhoR [Acidiferrobacterales bacterium]
MSENLWREVWILIGIALASLMLAEITGYPFLTAALGFGLYIASQLRNLVQLNRWLVSKREDVPDAGGLWGEVLDRIRALMKDTEQREDRLTEMLTRFQSASSATPDAMLIVSPHNEIEWANAASERLFGITTPRDAGQRLINLVRDPVFNTYLERGEYSEALEMTSPSQPQRSLSVRIIPFGSYQKLVIAHDTTHLAHLETMRSNFVANISHELRTPLTVLTGFLETLKDMDKPAGADLKKHFQTMHDQAQRMARLVEDLLTLSKLETTLPTRHEGAVDVPAMLAALKETGELVSGARHHHISLIADAGLRLSGNEEELRSAFSNLINNAVRYTPDGGDIRLTWKLDGDNPVFAVCDSGEGIAPQHIPHLTERFYRVDTARSRDTGGTGLGLSIVKHILLRHDAHLTIDSELGKGSTFSCVFPPARAVHTASVTVA